MGVGSGLLPYGIEVSNSVRLAYKDLSIKAMSLVTGPFVNFCISSI